jgi:hypothetical protein
MKSVSVFFKANCYEVVTFDSIKSRRGQVIVLRHTCAVYIMVLRMSITIIHYWKNCARAEGIMDRKCRILALVLHKKSHNIIDVNLISCSM